MGINYIRIMDEEYRKLEVKIFAREESKWQLKQRLNY